MIIAATATATGIAVIGLVIAITTISGTPHGSARPYASGTPNGSATHDAAVPKTSGRSASSVGSAQPPTTSPSNVKVEVLNGSVVMGLAGQAAAGLARRGFDVTGVGNVGGSAYASSVIVYASAADLAMVNTLKKELTHVTARQDASLPPGGVELILGSDFTGLKPLPAQPSVTPSPR